MTDDRPREIVLCYMMPTYCHVDVDTGKINKVAFTPDAIDYPAPYGALDFRGTDAVADELPLDSEEVLAAVAIANDDEVEWPPFQMD